MTGDVSRLRAMFHDEHDKRYSQSAPDESMECVSVRLVVTAARRERERVVEEWLNAPWHPEADFDESRREIVFADAAHPVQARVLWRPSLSAGMVINGPAVIEEPNATTLLHPGDVATISGAGHIIIRIGQEKSS
jgi:N-methylhydantoinase A